MISKGTKKHKVVWLCHFSNEQLQDVLKPLKRVPEYAPWIKSLIHLFENDDSIELHIVAQHEYLFLSKHFQYKGINYHIVRKGIPLLGRHWPRFFKWDRWTNYAFWKRKSRKLIKRIKPDLIHMHGFENEFCSTILQFKEDCPVFITIQGFVSQSKQQSKTLAIRKENELNIIRNFNHFGVRTKTMESDLKAINLEGQCYWHQYPIKVPKAREVDKIYDAVFFARITRDKGIVDLIKASAIIIKDFNPTFKLCVIGGGNYTEFKNLCEELNIANNVDWKGFLPTQQEVYNSAVQAKISVLPTYHDIVSGTIIESLFLKIPVVAYDTGSIHEVNEHEAIIELVAKFDIEGLAHAIHHLTSNEELINERAAKGYDRVMEMFGESDEEIKATILNIYSDVIKAENDLNE